MLTIEKLKEIWRLTDWNLLSVTEPSDYSKDYLLDLHKRVLEDGTYKGFTKEQKTAWDKLITLGCPLLHPDLEWGGVFAISTEFGTYGWCDYYEPLSTWDFGVSPLLREILSEQEMHGEWANAAVLCIYE